MREGESQGSEPPDERWRTAPGEGESSDGFEWLVIPHLTARQRARRASIAAGLPLLAVLAVLATFAPVRLRVRSALLGVPPTPTLAPNPSYNRLYLDVDAPWLRVTIDNHPVAVPVIGHQAPLRLSNGAHVLAWQGDPFMTAQCTLSAPAAADDTCVPYEEGELRTPGEPAARLIRVAEDLSTVKLGPRESLMSAINQRMAAVSGSDTLQAGESYFTYEHGIVRATTPLTATLTLAAVMQPTGGPMDDCLPNVQNSQVNGCPLDTEYCERVCSITYQYRAALAGMISRQAWLALIVYNPSWSYATPDGTVLAADEPIEQGGIGIHEQLAMLELSWDGTAWQTRVAYGPNRPDTTILGIQALGGSPLCLAANDYINGVTDPQVLATYSQVRILPAANPAQGCVAEGIAGSNAATSSPDAPRAIYLERFGLFLAANDLAHRNQPATSLANAYEQEIALSIVASNDGNPALGAAPGVSTPAVKRSRRRMR
jgi:hypothetical protein